MQTEQALAAFVFSLVAAGTPGPSNVLLTAAGANLGIVRGLRTVFGVGLSMGLMLFLVAFGLGGFLLDSPRALEMLRWGGTAFLLWLAFKIATAGPQSGEQPLRAFGFWPAAALQWVNPKSWLVSASAAATFLDPVASNAGLAALTLTLVFLTAALPCCLAWLSFGAVMQQVLKKGRQRRAFNMAMGGLLAASVIWMIR